MIISITGKSGCGKTTLANQIIETSTYEGVHLDIDKVAHYVLTLDEVKQELIKIFGSKILAENSINRRLLGSILYTSTDMMSIYNELMWKYIQIEVDKFIDENKNKLIILDWLFIPITKYFNMSDINILLDIPYEVRKQRTMLRDNITEEQFALRDNSSINFDDYTFDYVFKTNDIENVKRMVNLI